MSLLSFPPLILSCFLTQAWTIHCYTYPLGIICCENVCWRSREEFTMCFNLYLRYCRGWGLSELVSSCCVEFLRELSVDVRPRQASMLACVVLAGTSERLVSPRVLVWTHCRCCGAEWSCVIVLVKILHSVEGGDIEQVCSNLETILPCLRLLISLSLSHLCLYILHVYIVLIFTCLIYLCLLYAWVVCLLTLVFNQERNSGTWTLNLEESWGDSPKPFIGNSATLFGYTLCVCLIVLGCIIIF